jgi:hypothetical protein
MPRKGQPAGSRRVTSHTSRRASLTLEARATYQRQIAAIEPMNDKRNCVACKPQSGRCPLGRTKPGPATVWARGRRNSGGY